MTRNTAFTPRRDWPGFTLIELLVVISIIALLIGILLPALGAARQTARQLQSNTNVRSIHQGFVVFAQSNKASLTEGQFPGLDADGNLVDTDQLGYPDADWGTLNSGNHPNVRFGIALEENLFSPDTLINPIETEGIVPHDDCMACDWDVAPFYSYAMIEIWGNTAPTPAATEWAETINSRAVVIADRLVSGDPGADQNKGSHTQSGDDFHWRGSIAWNDNRVETANTTHHPTRYGFQNNDVDNIFDRDVGPAMFIHPDGAGGTDSFQDPG